MSNVQRWRTDGTTRRDDDGHWVLYSDHQAELDRLTPAVLEVCATIADMLEAGAEPGHGKETAAKIGAHIRALKDGGTR